MPKSHIYFTCTYVHVCDQIRHHVYILYVHVQCVYTYMYMYMKFFLPCRKLPFVNIFSTFPYPFLMTRYIYIHVIITVLQKFLSYSCIQSPHNLVLCIHCQSLSHTYMYIHVALHVKGVKIKSSRGAL